MSAIASTGGDVTTWLTTSQGLAEIYFGVWIASGYFPKESRMWTLAVFAAFFAFNVYQITQGYTSCGCFGAIRFPPLFSAGINFLIFGLTLFATAGENHRPSLNPILSGILITATIIGISLAAGFPRGGKVLVSPLAIELEYDFVNGMEYRIPLVVQNMSSAPVRISGWRTNHFYADIPSFQRMDLAPRD
ncbi:MAG: hypothetical protein JNL67_08575 [Planctomycetaceae bacterium]|nr:hypothetical protein [Planctomycetaceae bacterium]